MIDRYVFISAVVLVLIVGLVVGDVVAKPITIPPP